MSELLAPQIEQILTEIATNPEVFGFKQLPASPGKKTVGDNSQLGELSTIYSTYIYGREEPYSIASKKNISSPVLASKNAETYAAAFEATTLILEALITQNSNQRTVSAIKDFLTSPGTGDLEPLSKLILEDNQERKISVLDTLNNFKRNITNGELTDIARNGIETLAYNCFEIATKLDRAKELDVVNKMRQIHEFAASTVLSKAVERSIETTPVSIPTQAATAMVEAMTPQQPLVSPSPARETGFLEKLQMKWKALEEINQELHFESYVVKDERGNDRQIAYTCLERIRNGINALESAHRKGIRNINYLGIIPIHINDAINALNALYQKMKDVENDMKKANERLNTYGFDSDYTYTKSQIKNALREKFTWQLAPMSAELTEIIEQETANLFYFHDRAIQKSKE